MKVTSRILSFLAVLAGMLLLSAALLAVMSLVMLRGHMTGTFAGGSVIASYVIASLSGGFCLGWMQKKQKFLWGMLAGVCYFLVLFLVGRVAYHVAGTMGLREWSSCLICMVAGMLGGMLAPGNRKM